MTGDTLIYVTKTELDFIIYEATQSHRRVSSQSENKLRS